VDDVNLRLEFHRALDAVAPPAPWLADTVREENRRRRRMPRPALGRRSRPGLVFPPTARRLIAAALILVVAGTVAAATVAIYSETHRAIPVVPHASGPVSRECGQSNVYMVDPNVGWRGMQRTTDGGKTWHDVSPPSEPGAIKGGGTFCALDGGHAWATYGTGPGAYQADHVIVMSTSDGGQTWQQVAAIPIGFTTDWRINLSIEMDFLDLQHGWLLMEYLSKPVTRKLLATSDGGVHWTAVNRTAGLGLGDTVSGCPESGMMFVGLKLGWLTWDCFSGFLGDQPPPGGPTVAYTTDGGVTWKWLNLPGYPTGNDRQCGAKPPIFSGTVGVFEVTCTGMAQGFAVYSTIDLGQTWAVHPLSVYATVDFLNGTTGFYFTQADQKGPSTLYRTDDSGSHWTAVAKNLFPGKNLSGLTFIDDKVGFVSVSDSPADWWTDDGGKTWSLPAPYRSAGSTVCNVFADPGAASRLPQDVKMVSPTIGWAKGTRRTTDGGATWTNLAPPAPKYRDAGYGEFFLDATHAWVVDAVGSATACVDRFVVYSTSDGAATWQQVGSVPRQGVSASAVALEFLDSQTGWLYVPSNGYYAGARTGPLYKTLDGGKSWTLVAAKAAWSSGACSAAGLPLFSSPTTGWMPTTCTDNTRSSMDLLVTRDGGQTWTSQELIKHYCDLQAYPDGCVIAGPGPQFLDASNGWILDTNGPTLLMTTDGGGTWVRHGLPSFTSYACQGKYGPTTCTNQFVVTATFVTPAEGWLILGDYPGSGDRIKVRVEHTVDGGHSWAPLYVLDASTQDDVTGSLLFVDPNDGFWWLGSNLLRTGDGGHTWTSVHMTYS
jgi:photosystem II stability/assembly factor-like uncharacterized protein